MAFLFFLVYFIHYFVGQLIEIYKLKVLAVLAAVILLGLTFYFTLGLYYTADYEFYDYMFRRELKTDLLYEFLTKVFKANYWEFHDLFVTHLILYVLLFYFVISRFTINVFYVFLTYILFDYVHFSNQIRYFLGFGFMLVAFYSLYNKRYIAFVLFAGLALTSHIALVVLLSFIPVYYLIKPEKYFRYLVLSSVACFFIVYLSFSLGVGREIEHFGEYFKEDGISSFLGGLYNSTVYIVLLTLIYFETRRYLRKNPDAFDDLTFNFLFKIVFYTVIFIPTSFFIQIAAHRYVMPFVIFYVIFYLYLIKNNSARIKNLKMMLFSSVCFLLSLIVYYVPYFLFPENHFMTEIERMLKSVPYINYELW